MPRKPRMFVPGIPAHIVQRGNNRQATFFDDKVEETGPECVFFNQKQLKTKSI